MMHCHFISDASDWERGQDYEIVQGRFQVGMQAPGTTDENCTEITGRLRWKIQISSDCPQDLAQIEGRFAQFFGGSSASSKGAWQ